MQKNTLTPKLSEGETAILADMEWIIPKLRGAQLVKVFPAITRINVGLSESRSSFTANKGNLVVSEALIEDLVVAWYHALAWNYPNLNRAAFDNLIYTMDELIAGLDPIRRAAGLVAVAEKDTKPAPETPMGEDGAQTSQTG